MCPNLSPLPARLGRLRGMTSDTNLGNPQPSPGSERLQMATNWQHHFEAQLLQHWPTPSTKWLRTSTCMCLGIPVSQPQRTQVSVRDTKPPETLAVLDGLSAAGLLPAPCTFVFCRNGSELPASSDFILKPPLQYDRIGNIGRLVDKQNRTRECPGCQHEIPMHTAFLLPVHAGNSQHSRMRIFDNSLNAIDRIPQRSG